MNEELKKWVREIPDFPKKGILFRDITPVLLEADVFKRVCDILYERYKGRKIDKVAAIESRGFIFAAVVAYRLGKGFIPLRKPGKLPHQTIEERYSLEYGEAALEMHTDAVSPGDRVVVIDDLLATGGTAAAAVNLIERQGGVIDEIAFVIELSDLGGIDKLQGKPVFSLLSF